MYTLQFAKQDTLSATLLSGATSTTITTGNFGTTTSQVYVVDWDVPAKAEIILASTSTTSVTSITRGLTGGASGTTDHQIGAKIASIFVPQHYAALQPVSAITNTFTVSALDDGPTVTAVSGDGWKDVTNLTQTITTRGGNVDVKFCFPFDNTTSGGTTIFQILDGATMKAKVSAAPGSVGPRIIVSGVVTIPGLSAGSHTIKMQMQMLAGGGATARAFYGQSTYSVTEQSS